MKLPPLDGQFEAALKTSDVMRILNLKDPRAVYRLVREGKLKAGQLGKRSYRYSRAAVEEFLAGGSVSNQKPQAGGKSPPERPPVPRAFARPDVPRSVRR